MDYFKSNLQKSNKYLKDIRKYFIYIRITPDTEIESQDLLLLHQLLPQRIHQLGTSAYNELKKGNWLSGSTLARAAGETLVVLVILNIKANEVAKNYKTEEMLDLANQLLFSTRILYEESFIEFYKKYGQREVPKDEIYYKATNILTQLKKAEQKIPDFKLYYQFISEYCHPCTFGIFTSGESINDEDLNNFKQKTTNIAMSISSSFLRVTLAKTYTIMLENEGLFKKIFKDDKKYYKGRMSNVMKKLEKYPSILKIVKDDGFFKLIELYNKD